MNKNEIIYYEQTLKDFNPFYGVEFPITSMRLTDIINGLREQHNEKVVTLRHDHLMQKVKDFCFGADPNFRVSKMLRKDISGKQVECFILCKNSCRVLASTESKTINKLIMVYLAQLEAIFDKAKHDKVAAFDNKLLKHGITWREACNVAGINRSGLALKYMIEAGHMKKDWSGRITLRSSLIDDGSFRYVQTQGRNKEGFRVLKKGFDRLQKSADDIGWKCLKYSTSKRDQAIYKQKLELYKQNQPKVYDEYGFEI